MTSKDKKKDVNHFLAGSLARATAAIVMCPADTIKTRLQFQGSASGEMIRSYKGFTDAFRTIWKTEGSQGFTRGLGARLIYVLPAAGISFLCYEKVVQVFRQPDASQSGYAAAILPLIGIASARLLGTTVRTPFDIAKNRLQVQATLQKGFQYRNSWQAAKHIWKSDGMKGTLKLVPVSVSPCAISTHPTLCVKDASFTHKVGDAPFAFLYFSTYELFKSVQLWLFYDNSRDVSKLQVWNHTLAGAGAGALSSALTVPFDVLKTRLQTQEALGHDKYNGIRDAFKTIVKEEGYRGLTRGLSARLIYISPAAAIVFTTYEQYKKMFDYLFPPT